MDYFKYLLCRVIKYKKVSKEYITHSKERDAYWIIIIIIIKQAKRLSGLTLLSPFMKWLVDLLEHILAGSLKCWKYGALECFTVRHLDGSLQCTCRRAANGIYHTLPQDSKNCYDFCRFEGAGSIFNQAMPGELANCLASEKIIYFINISNSYI